MIKISGLPCKSSAIFENFQKMFGNVYLAFRQLFGQLFGNLRKIVKKSSPICSQNKQNKTWLLVDMEFLFPCSTLHLTHLLHSLMRYQVEHLKRNSASTHTHVLSSGYVSYK